MSTETEYIHLKYASAVKRVGCKAYLVPQAEIVEYFSDVRTKNEIIDGFFKFAGRCFHNLAIFLVFSGSLQFLKGRGDNIKDQPLLGSFNVEKNSVFRRVVVNSFPYRGPVPVGVEEKAVFNRFFTGHAEEVYIYPGNIVNEDTDILFYADSFIADRESSQATYEYVIEKTVLALKLLWIQKQLVTV